MGENISGNETTDKGLIFKIYEQLMQAQLKKKEKASGWKKGGTVDQLPRVDCVSEGHPIHEGLVAESRWSGGPGE